jgi:hypothetical protein
MTKPRSTKEYRDGCISFVDFAIWNVDWFVVISQFVHSLCLILYVNWFIVIN